jgi:hypothetical protein
MKTNLLYQMLSSKKLSIGIIALLFSINSFGVSINTSITWDVSYFTSNPTPSFGTWDGVNNILTMNALEIISVDRGGNPGRVEFVIDGITIVFSSTISQITVSEGESLEITSATVTSSSSYWFGIIALGESSERQFATGSTLPPKEVPFDGSTSYNTAQTIVNINSNSEINLARWGVRSDDGAILLCDNVTFNDCEKSIGFTPYTHQGPEDLIEVRNASHVTDCNFIWNNIIGFPLGAGFITDFTTRNAIRLVGVYGIHIQGISIANTNTSYEVCGNRGLGVFASDAIFLMHASGTPTTPDANGCFVYSGGRDNNIGDISMGVDIVESATIPTIRAEATIIDLTTTRVQFGVNSLRGSSLVIRTCNFNLEEADRYIDNSLSGGSCFGDKYFGVNLNATEKFVINNSGFSGIPLADDPDDVRFVIANNCGTKDNKIYSNFFSVTGADPVSNTTDFIGVELRGTNSNIEIGCNNFTDVYKAIQVNSGANVGTSWTNSLNDEEQMKNTFTNTTAFSFIDLNNLSATPIDYKATTFEWNTSPTPIVRAPFLSWTNTAASLEGTCTVMRCDVQQVGLSSKKITKEIFANVYPNPATTALSISFENEFSGTVKLVDIAGKQLLHQKVSNSTSLPLNVSQIASGIYFLQISNANGAQHVFKIVVQK